MRHAQELNIRAMMQHVSASAMKDELPMNGAASR
jgi:hypothetical protein